MYHNAMSVPQKPDPRANQKWRTRNALVEAARKLLEAGIRPTVAEAAEEARVSRATAYRYFPTQDALLAEAAFTPAVADIDKLIAAETSPDPEARLMKLLDSFNPLVLAEERAMRMALRAYLDAWFQAAGTESEGNPVREGRRMRWLDKALGPLRGGLREAEYRRLQAALALTLGVEPIIVMKDVCGIEGYEALAVLRWVARTLLREARA